MSNRFFLSPALRTLKERFKRLYGERAEQCFERLVMLVGRYGVADKFPAEPREWSERDALLITYGDTLTAEKEKPLETLHAFIREKLRSVINAVHILPFCPYSSDDGFSVIDYRAVRQELGSWGDLHAISKTVHLMADLVLNHVSRESSWFSRYAAGYAPERHYFIEVAPGTDLSQVVRPRSFPLLSPVYTQSGERYVWTTFSDDQIDLDFSNPDVLFEFLDILFLYISKGVRIIRLDAIAYLWKEIGTSCIHLWQTHEVVKIIRNVLEIVAPDVWLVSETNVPHKENISYFGEGDEAHIVYQFSLPPLLFHAIETGNTRYLTEWLASSEQAPPRCTFLNFTASHDGIGVRPLEGLVPDAEVQGLLECVRRREGFVSTKNNADGTQSPYEMNITYFDAFADPEQRCTDIHVMKFLCSQTAALALAGIPGIYFHNLVATGNDQEGVKRTGRARSINRKKLDAETLSRRLEDPESVQHKVFNHYTRLLQIRSSHPAFHPEGTQRVIDMGPSLFAVERTSPDEDESLLAVSNFSAEETTVSLEKSFPALRYAPSWMDCISGRVHQGGCRRIELAPYQTAWIIPL